MFALATKLKVNEVKAATEKLILSTLNESNALNIFIFAHSYKSDKIKHAAFEEIKNMFPDRKLANELINDIEAVKVLVKIKEEVDAIMKKINKFEAKQTSR